MEDQSGYEELLPSYFSGSLTEVDKMALENWKEASEENRIIFGDAKKVWQSLNLLQEMKNYNMPSALRRVHEKTDQRTGQHYGSFLFYWQRIAAILILPLLFSGVVYFIQKHSSEKTVAWQTISTPPGIKSQIKLPDGTLVWLNSGTNLSYPLAFSDGARNVKLSGEAFFDVVKDEKHPFIVDLGKINIEVLGTKFNAINYDQEGQTEVVLASGKVKLLEKNENKSWTIATLQPGQQATYNKTRKTISLKKIDTGKYTSWIEGKLIFRDDPIGEVVNRLNRWFNVQIEITDPDIGDYIYTATFQNETIEQILSLIKRTSPVEYTIIPGEQLSDGTFEKQQIILKKR